MKLHRIAAASAIVLAASLAPVLAAVSPLDLVQPIADYKIYVQDKIDTLEARTKDFTDAVKAGDLAKAKALYAPARVNYEMIEPIAELFSDLDGAIDSRADDHEQKEKSADFTGFHRIEYGLFSQNSTEGLAPIADKLYADVVDLKKRVAGLTVPPEKAIDGAAGLLEEVASSKISGEEDRYSHTDLWDFKANVEGSQAAVAALRPVIDEKDKALGPLLDQRFAAVDTLLEQYRVGDGFTLYTELTDEDKKKMTDAVDALSEPISQVAAVVTS